MGTSTFVQGAKEFVRRGLISGSAGLNRNGTWSKMLNGILRGYDDQFAATVSQKLQKIAPDLELINKDPIRVKMVVDQLRGTRVSSDPLSFRTALKVRKLFTDTYAEAAASGVNVAPFRKNYWPKLWNPKLFEGVSRERMIRHLQDTGQAQNRAHAEDLLEFANPGGRKFHPLESRRILNLPGEREDLGVIVDYLDGAVKRTQQTKMFGANDQKLQTIFSQIALTENRGNEKFARLVGETFLGRPIGAGARRAGEGPLAGALGKMQPTIASIEAMSKLSLAVVSNVSQPLNTVVRAGIGPTYKAFKDVINDWGSAKAFGIKTGAVYHQTLMDLRRELAHEADTVGAAVLRYTGFSWIEKFNRLLSANMGKHMALDTFDDLVANQANHIARVRLKSLGIDANKALKSGGLSQDDLLLAGKKLSDQTQFRSTALDLPVAWRGHPGMKILTLYKNFAFNQTRFIKDFVLKPAFQHGDMKPLMYMAILFPTFGEIIADTKVFLRRGTLKDRPKYFLDRMIDNMAQVGSLGIMEDVQRNVFSGDPLKVFTFFLGPVSSDVSDFVRAFGSKNKGRAVARQLTRRIPVIGPIAGEALFHRPGRRPRGPLQRGFVTKAVRKVTKPLKNLLSREENQDSSRLEQLRKRR